LDSIIDLGHELAVSWPLINLNSAIEARLSPGLYAFEAAIRNSYERRARRHRMMWAITSYYNPVRSKRRLSNYRIFRANLRAPLIAVELSFDGKFELTREDADILVQLSGGAVLWQKERLLNVGLQSLPPDADSLAWLDCDVIFDRPDWVAQAEAQLRQNDFVQLFSEMVDLSRDDLSIRSEHADIAPSAYGLVRLATTDVEKAFTVVQPRPTKRPVSRGLAWAGKRSVLDQHGFYDALIVGSGDRSMVFAMYGRFEDLMNSLAMTDAQRNHYMRWAAPFHEVVRGRITHIPGRIYHLWHGDLQDRGYHERHKMLSKYDFDPEADVKVGPSGAWEWARPRPDLAEFLARYFASRNEQ
jgi:hypothetical protein